MDQLNGYRLRNAPLPLKTLAVGFLLSVGLGYAYAVANIALVVGLGRDEIAQHYYGSTTRIAKAPSAPAAAGEQALDLDAETVAASAPVAQPSAKKLVAEGHFHLLGMASFFFGLAALALFTSVPERLKAIMIGGAFFAIVVDNVSFMTVRFLGPDFAYLTAAAGSLLGVSFASLWFSIAWEVTRRPDGVVLSTTAPRLAASRVFVALLAVASAGLLSAQPALAEKVMELKDFLKEGLGDAPKKSKEDFALSAEQKAALAKVAPRANESSMTFYYGKTDGGDLKVACTVVAQEGKEGPMTIGVCFDAAGLVSNVRVLDFVEDHGKKVKEQAFLKQFHGKKAAAAFKLGTDVDAISGATRSSESVAEAVRKASFGYTQLVAKKAGK